MTARPRHPVGKALPKGPVDPGTISPVRLAVITYGLPVLFLGGILVYATRLFSFITPEALSLNESAVPFASIFSSLHAGIGLGHTPPLYALIMHVYLFLSAGALGWLRAPSALFYVAGLWFLSSAARRWADGAPAAILLLLGAFWPYGFHYGTLADSYSLAFLLTCALLLCHLRYLDAPSTKLWARTCALVIALVYTTYLGWAVLAFLWVSDWLHSREQGRPAASRLLVAAAAIAILYTPLWPAFVRDILQAARAHLSLRQLALNAGYNLYVLLASESIAPWFWRFAVPVALAIVASLALLLAPPAARRSPLSFFGTSACSCSLDTKAGGAADRLLLVAPWFLLPIAIALGTIEPRAVQRALLICLVVIGGIGWFGTYSRIYYAASDFFEPWLGLAAGAAGAVHEGAGVISNSEPFFFYLTYALAEPPAEPGLAWRYLGSLPDTIRDPHIWSPAGWEAAERPIPPYARSG